MRQVAITVISIALTCASGCASRSWTGTWVPVDGGWEAPAAGQPLLVLDHKGKGRVALLTSDQAWLWARGYEGGGPHSDLLRRLSHWLMKEPDLEEERLVASARGNSATIFPCRITMMRSQMPSTSGSSLETTTTPTPRSASA